MSNWQIRGDGDRFTGNADPYLLADLRERYDKAVTWGTLTNRHRDWPSGRHPGYILAKRLQDKAIQVWRFTVDFAVPFTNYADVWVIPMLV